MIPDDFKAQLGELARRLDEANIPDPTHYFCAKCDRWVPIKAVCEHLAPLLEEGGQIISHDYYAPPGAEKAKVTA